MHIYIHHGCYCRMCDVYNHAKTYVHINSDCCEFVRQVGPITMDTSLLEPIWWINTDGTYSFSSLPPVYPVFPQDDWVPQPPELSDPDATYPDDGYMGGSWDPNNIPQTPTFRPCLSPGTAIPRDSTFSDPFTPAPDLGASPIGFNPLATPFAPQPEEQPQGRLRDLLAGSEELPPLSRVSEGCPFGVIGKKRRWRPESVLDGFHLIPSDLFDDED